MIKSRERGGGADLVALLVHEGGELEALLGDGHALQVDRPHLDPAFEQRQVRRLLDRGDDIVDVPRYQAPEGVLGLGAEFFDPAGGVGPALQDLDVAAGPGGEQFVVLLGHDLSGRFGLGQFAEHLVQLATASGYESGQSDPWVNSVLDLGVGPGRDEEIQLSQLVQDAVNFTQWTIH